MMNGATLTRESRQGKRIGISRLAVSRRFGKYKDEEKQAVRKTDLIKDQKLMQLKETLMKVRLIQHKDDEETITRDYSTCLEIVKKLEYTSKDLENLSIALADLPIADDSFWKAGIFLSALINNSPENEFTIHISQLCGEIYCLGVFNTKNMTIEGDTGPCLANYMSGGKIFVKGNVDADTGYGMVNGEITINGSCKTVGDCMEGGRISVNGNVENTAGYFMVNGVITINGDCGDDAGLSMKGGKIIVEGNVKNRVGTNMFGGTIIIKGDVGQLTGNEMKGGCIRILGNANSIGKEMEGGCIIVMGDAKVIGEEMHGGEIYLEGEIGSIGKVKHGKIHHKGKLIVDK